MVIGSVLFLRTRWSHYFYKLAKRVTVYRLSSDGKLAQEFILYDWGGILLQNQHLKEELNFQRSLKIKRLRVHWKLLVSKYASSKDHKLTDGASKIVRRKCDDSRKSEKKTSDQSNIS